ncbi:exodeoxyribonuclease VII small subunit [Luteolibacter sp. AS25]|uniref:exodeoxyribonuclease VII small subunit n=1 Tax=Luteolibacter sp. AS25 TaxID=3135776 RepID=UPI00398A7BCC
MPAPKKSVKSALTFEQALSGLSEIVNEMEGEQLPLEDLVKQYEAGTKLLKQCESVLAAAQKKIELITLSDSEEPASSTRKDSPDIDDQNDISLF